MIKRYLGALALVCALAGSLLSAQNTTTFGNIVSMGVPCGSANCVYYQLPPGTAWVNLTISGAWTGTVEIATSSAPNANYSNLNAIAWTPLATETANGTWSAATSGAVYLRARATTWSNGAARVDMASSLVGSPQFSPLFAGPVTVSAGGAAFQAQFNCGGVLCGSLATFDQSGNFVTPGSVTSVKISSSGAAYANVPTIPGLTTIGDSIYHGTGANANQFGLEYQVSSYLGGPNSNWSISGQSITDEPVQLLTNGWAIPTLSRNAAMLEGAGHNDAGGCTGDPTCDTNSQLALQAVIAMAGTANQQPAAQAVADSTWAADGTLTSCNNSQTNGGVLTFANMTTYGAPIYVLAQILHTNSGNASVTIDGVLAGSFNASASGSISNSPRNSVFGYPFTAAAGTHTVAITVTSPTGAGNVVSVCGISSGESADQIAGIGHPLVSAVEVVPYQNNANQTWIDAINAVKQGVVATMALQGFGVRWNPTVNSPFSGNFIPAAYIGLQGTSAISSWSCAGSPTYICTFQDDGTQVYQATAMAQLSGFGTTTVFNGKRAPILSAGLTTSQFEVALPGVPAGSGTEVGSVAVVDPSGTVCSRFGADDNVHPNQCGHDAIARALKYDLNPGFSSQGTNTYLQETTISGDHTMLQTDTTIQTVSLSGAHTITMPGNFPPNLAKVFVFTKTAGGVPTFAAGSGAFLQNFPSTLGLNCSLTVHNTGAFWYADSYYCPGGSANSLSLTTTAVSGDYTLVGGEGILSFSCSAPCTLTIPVISNNNGPIELVKTAGFPVSIAASGTTLVNIPSTLELNKPMEIESTGGAFWYNVTGRALPQQTITAAYAPVSSDGVLNVNLTAPATITFNNIGSYGPFYLTKTGGNVATLAAGAGVTLHNFPTTLTLNLPIAVYAVGNDWYNVTSFTVTANSAIGFVTSALSTTWTTTQGPTTYYTTTQAGHYRLCGFADITVAGTGAGTWQLTQTYVGDGHAFGGIKMGISLTNATQWSTNTGGTTSVCQTAYIDLGSVVQWTITPTGTITTAPTMRYTFSAEYLNP